MVSSGSINLIRSTPIFASIVTISIGIETDGMVVPPKWASIKSIGRPALEYRSGIALRSSTRSVSPVM